MSCGGFSSCRKAMCSSFMEDMMDSPDGDVAEIHENKLKRGQHHILDF
jgi:hypothetical protein